MNDGLFWAAKQVDGQLQFFRDRTPTPGAAEAVLEKDRSNFVLDEKGVRKMTESELSERAAQLAVENEAREAIKIAKDNEWAAAQEKAAADYDKWMKDQLNWRKLDRVLFALAKPKEMSEADWQKRFDEEWSKLDA